MCLDILGGMIVREESDPLPGAWVVDADSGSATRTLRTGHAESVLQQLLGKRVLSQLNKHTAASGGMLTAQMELLCCMTMRYTSQHCAVGFLTWRCASL
jgi:hypothetical protein